MNTNRHENRSASLNHKRHQNASEILLLSYYFVSFVDNPSKCVVTPTNKQLTDLLVSIRVHSWITLFP